MQNQINLETSAEAEIKRMRDIVEGATNLLLTIREVLLVALLNFLSRKAGK